MRTTQIEQIKGAVPYVGAIRKSPSLCKKRSERKRGTRPGKRAGS